ncbi:hypothetical protein, partial [Staphylococcus saprophyticus]|uniref:hypothetical protein n=1 Tax=Staphylococcus saprophyticus TaxID=29385 RepID=UPI0028988415
VTLLAAQAESSNVMQLANSMYLWRKVFISPPGLQLHRKSRFGSHLSGIKANSLRSAYLQEMPFRITTIPK